jgi:polyphosphate kinase 2 (PPK2 family)
MVLVKFWLHISADEQLERFEKRANDPLKKWKLTDEDWRNRRKRDEYCAALEDMFERTDHEAGAWHIIPADSKKYTRVTVIEHVIEAAESGMRANGIDPIPAEELGI